MTSKQNSNVIRNLEFQHEYNRGKLFNARNEGRITEQQFNDKMRDLQAEKFFAINRLRS